MHTEDLVAGVALLALVAYAVFGGADFGGGIWDALASGPRRDEQRSTIAHAMGPVWEANHVWLIFVIVLLFSAFPTAFWALSIGLYVPLHLVLVGVTARGVSFAFRGYAPMSPTAQSRWGRLFGAASVLTPMLLGAALGAVSSGALRVSNTAVHADGVVWLSPLSLAMGFFAVALCAYVSAVFLAVETDGALQDDFRTRALIAGTFVVAGAVALVPLLAWRAEHLWHGLRSARALPAVLAGVVASLLSGWWLRTRRYRAARMAASAQVALLVTGWALAMYPYVIYPDVTLHNAAASQPTLRAVLLITVAGMAVLIPSLVLLFRVFKGQRASDTTRAH